MRDLAEAALAIGVLAAASHAGTTMDTLIYTWREANGTAAYAQFPPASGRHGPVSLMRLSKPAALDGPPVERAASVEPAPSGLDERRRVADVGVQEAAMRLAETQRAVADGREPLPGERIGTVSHHSRLRPEYFARQRELLQAMHQAQAALVRAQSRQRALQAATAD